MDQVKDEIVGGHNTILGELKNPSQGLTKKITNFKIYKKERVKRMLWTIVGVLVILWLLGFVTATGGGLIHILLVIALIVVVVQLLQGRKL